MHVGMGVGAGAVVVIRIRTSIPQALECSLKALSLCGTAPATSVETIKQIFESSLQ